METLSPHVFELTDPEIVHADRRLIAVYLSAHGPAAIADPTLSMHRLTYRVPVVGTRRGVWVVADRMPGWCHEAEASEHLLLGIVPGETVKGLRSVSDRIERAIRECVIDPVRAADLSVPRT